MFSSLFTFILLASTSLSLPLNLLDLNSPLSNSINLIEESTNTTQTVNSTIYTFNTTVPSSLACNFAQAVQQDEDVAALPLSFFNSSNQISTYCGAYIILNSNITQKTLTVRIVDVALTPSIALSRTVFAGLNSTVGGLGLVNWRFATINETEDALEGSIRAESLAAMIGAASILSQMKPTVAAVIVAATPTVVAYTPAYTPDYTPAATPAYTPVYTPAATVEAAAAVSTPDSNQSSSSSAFSSDSYSGQATYYTQGGVAGACGKVNPDSAYIVAIDIDMYNGGSNCGRTVHITNTATGAAVTAVVADECPTCASSGSLDLSVAAFNAIGNESQGVIPMTWSFV